MSSTADYGIGQRVGLAAALLLSTTTLFGAAPPVVSNVRAAQRPGTKLVDIYYDVADPDSAALTVSVAVSTNGGAGYTLPATSFSGSGYGSTVTPGSHKQIVWNAGADWNGKFSANVRFQVTASDDSAPSGMALIPAGSFTMGNTFTASEGYSDELPLHSVYVSAFYLDRYEVTKALWDEVYNWALTHGYTFDYADSGQGKAANHPAHTMTWYDAVKWCNARSEKENKVPAYYTDAGLTTRYRSGQVAPYVDWSRGYRLATEAEWEKAARGGASGRRFPWSGTDNITHSMANYYSSTSYAYDTSLTRGYPPGFQAGGYPYTSPVDYFAPNGYGLYDMAGNVWQWCWDWYSSSYYGSSPASDPRGPATGSYRVMRGGCWLNSAFFCRAAFRFILDPSIRGFSIGFRSALPPGQ